MRLEREPALDPRTDNHENNWNEAKRLNDLNEWNPPFHELLNFGRFYSHLV